MSLFPGLVFEPYLEDLLQKASKKGRNCSRVSILEIKGDSDPTWETGPAGKGFDEAGLRRWLASNQLNKTSNSVHTTRIFFVTGKADPATYDVFFDPKILGALQKGAGLSERFISDIYRIEPWTKLDTSSIIRQDESSSSLTLDYGFWSWLVDEPFHSFVECQADLQSTTYFCINCPTPFIERIKGTAMATPQLLKKKFLVEVLIADEVLRCIRDAISARNSGLICIEKDTDKTSIEARTKSLHDLSVDWHTVVKDLTDLDMHCSHLLELYERFVGSGDEQRDGDEGIGGCNQSLKRLLLECRFYYRWAICYRDRTNSRINLVHHLATQQDNRLTQEINTLTTQVALQTQRDGAAMHSIAVVTAVFLPGTFVASILSTVFFSFDGSQFVISNWWWTLPVSTVPLTIGVLCLWFLWFRARLNRDRAALLENKTAEMELQALSSVSTRRS